MNANGCSVPIKSETRLATKIELVSASDIASTAQPACGEPLGMWVRRNCAPYRLFNRLRARQHRTAKVALRPSDKIGGAKTAIRHEFVHRRSIADLSNKLLDKRACGVNSSWHWSAGVCRRGLCRQCLHNWYHAVQGDRDNATLGCWASVA